MPGERNGCFSVKHGKSLKALAAEGGTVDAGLHDQLGVNDPDMDRILEKMLEATKPWDIYGQPRSDADIAAAQDRYLRLRDQADTARARREGEEQARRDRAVAEQRAIAETDRVRLAENEARAKYMIEQQRVDIEKARLVVTAIKEIGTDPALREAFGPMLHDLSKKLIGSDAGDEVAKGLKLLESVPIPAPEKKSGSPS
jgi:phage-related minor tail protein